MDVAAPGSDETLHEYKTEGETTKQFTHQIAETRSLISKTSEEILLQVENELQGLSSSFSVQLQQIQSQVTGLDGQVSTIAQKVDNITLSVTNGSTSSSISLSVGGVEVSSETIQMNGLVTITGLANGTTTIDGACIKTGTIEAERLNLTGAITWGDLADDAQSSINGAYTAANAAQTLASSAYNQANAVGNTVTAWTYPGSTYINGEMLMTGTVMASKLLGGTVGLLASNQTVVGSLDIAYTTTGVGLGITTQYGGMRLQAMGGNVYIESGYGPFLQLGIGTQNVAAALCQFGGGPFVLSSHSYGTSLPTSGVQGQVFFLLGG